MFNEICAADEEKMNPIYGRIIYKNPVLFLKQNIIKTKYKPSLDKIKIIINNKENDEEENDDNLNSIINYILFINKEESNIYLLIYLTIYNYIINVSFNKEENNYIINFHSLNKILQIIF